MNTYLSFFRNPPHPFTKHGKSHIKPPAKSSYGICRTTDRQLEYDRTAIGVRPYGNCRTVTSKGARKNFFGAKQKANGLTISLKLKTRSRPTIHFHPVRDLKNPTYDVLGYFRMKRNIIIFVTSIQITDAMSIKYEIHSIQNAQGTGKERHYAHIYEQPAMTPQQLASRIQDSCSLTKSDVEGTVSALREAMIRELEQGHRFYIPKIGYFSLSVELEIPDGKPIDKVRGDDIKVRNINFQPDASMLQEIKSHSRFEHAEFSTLSKKLSEESLLKKITVFLSKHECLTRRDMELEFGLRRSTSYKWLKHFTETGALKKKGTLSSPVYFLAE